ncbi:hypothetical protein [Actinoplanes aureus]|uniref:Uncharacterized protein n=1 Tax=Actinoplanes aureus TaxID=2792083 RepID=A0A931CK75_9ACTN|nr:hypothetical protein [Actinoplanes aureus]MBG0569197.1 hypothetical protein [Actinoplanes aureus]
MSVVNRRTRAGANTGPARWWLVAGRLVLLGSAAASAVAWALGVTVLQPLSEPTGPDAFAEDNTYWARELRWGALIALLLVLILLARGGRWTTWGVLVSGCAWLAVDVGLDRIDYNSDSTKLGIGAAAAALICCAVVMVVPAVPRPNALLAVAMVAAVASGMATATESPTDVEPALNTGSAAVGSLLALVAVAAAVQTAGPVDRPGVRTTVAVGILALATPWLLRHVWPQPSGARLLVTFAFAVLLVVVVVALAKTRPGPRQDRYSYGVVAAIAVVALPMMLWPLALLALVVQIGRPFTELAANTPIHSADADAVMIVLTIPMGLILARTLRNFVFDQPASAPGRDLRRG